MMNDVTLNLTNYY